jgi:hypothetical protein
MPDSGSCPRAIVSYKKIPTPSCPGTNDNAKLCNSEGSYNSLLNLAHSMVHGQGSEQAGEPCNTDLSIDFFIISVIC